MHKHTLSWTSPNFPTDSFICVSIRMCIGVHTDRYIKLRKFTSRWSVLMSHKKDSLNSGWQWFNDWALSTFLQWYKLTVNIIKSEKNESYPDVSERHNKKVHLQAPPSINLTHWWAAAGETVDCICSSLQQKDTFFVGTVLDQPSKAMGHFICGIVLFCLITRPTGWGRHILYIQS